MAKRNEEMRSMRKQGMTLKAIGRHFNISAPAVSKIVGTTREIAEKARQNATAYAWSVEGLRPEYKFILLAIADAAGMSFTKTDAIECAVRLTKYSPGYYKAIFEKLVRDGHIEITNEGEWRVAGGAK